MTEATDLLNSPAEISAYNAGVEAVLGIAQRAAAAIAATGHRHVHEEFAIAALGELAEAGRALLLSTASRDATERGAP